MSLKSFTIHFDNPFATYYSGQYVAGRVHIRLSRPKKVRGIYIKCTGVSSVYWSEEREIHRHGQKHKEMCHYNSHEPYFENTFYLLGGPSGEISLPGGEHVLPFSFMLPPTIPSSFEGEFGHVRYTVKATISRPWRFDHDCKVAFTVINPLDLNLEPNVQAPVQRTEEKTLYCCCCRSLPITLVVSMPFTGFVCGQVCPAVVEIDNPTETSVTVKCVLKQKVTFTAYFEGTTQMKEVTNIVGRHNIKTVRQRSSDTSRIEMRIDALPTSHLRNCNNINISYKFEFTGSFSGAHMDMSMSVPIVIGTIPLRAQFSSLMPQPGLVPGPSVHYPPQAMTSAKELGLAQPQMPSAPPEAFQNYPDMQPPTYEECMARKANIRGADDSEYVQGVLEFAPRYPTYKFQPPQ